MFLYTKFENTPEEKKQFKTKVGQQFTELKKEFSEDKNFETFFKCIKNSVKTMKIVDPLNTTTLRDTLLGKM